MATKTPPSNPRLVPAAAACGSAKAPSLSGVISTTNANGSESRKKSPSEVIPTTRIPATFRTVHAAMTNRPARTPWFPSPNQGADLLQIKKKECRIDRHVKNAGGEREPRFLEAPEISQAPSNPRVVAAFLRQSTGKFSDHEEERRVGKECRSRW